MVTALKSPATQRRLFSLPSLPLRLPKASQELTNKVVDIERRLNVLERRLKAQGNFNEYSLEVQRLTQEIESPEVKASGKYAELRSHLLGVAAAVSIGVIAGNFTESPLNAFSMFNTNSVEIQQNSNGRSMSTETATATAKRAPQIKAVDQRSDRSLNFHSIFNRRSTPVQANVNLNQDILVQAIIEQESSGRFNLVNKDSGALGFFQVMPANVPEWSRQALGRELNPDEFLQSPKLQMKIGQYKIAEYTRSQMRPGRSNEEVARRVFSLWYSGKANRWNDPKPQVYNGTNYPSIAQYTASVWNKYQSLLVAPKVGSSAQRVVDIAHRWVGKDFKPGMSARCADFMRHILREAGLSVPVSEQPIDKAIQWNGPYGLRAQSFFGTDVGIIIRDKSKLQPGDLIAWANTYGNFAPGAITHVGLYVGDGMVIDRSTRSQPIRKRSIDTFPHFVAGVRLHAYQ